MSKVKHIILREYTTRVRKKAFIIMTIIGPLLFAALMIAPVWLTQLEDQEEKKIAIVEYDRFGYPVQDSLMLFRGVFPDKELLKFEYIGNLSELQVEALAVESDYFGFLKIKHNVITSGQDVSVEFLVKEQPSIGIEMHITNSLEKYLQNYKLLSFNVPPNVIKSLKTHVNLATKKLHKDGFTDQGDNNIRRVLGYVCGLMIYMFIFFFGAQVMRGVVEEKTNRIIEVVITSVKPFQLMLGKIIGIGLVGLTQFLAWMILTVIIYQFSGHLILKDKLETLQKEETSTELFQSQPETQINTETTQTDVDFTGLMDKIQDIDILLVLGLFLFFFIAGYLLYAAMFAAIGSAVDNETDTQQFMMPVTIPLILSIVVMANAISNPSGQLAFWFSMIPFTSPIIMMARIPFGVPTIQIIASMTILVASFIIFTWMSGKIYRTGILMYGKKVNLKEIIRWMRYK